MLQAQPLEVLAIFNETALRIKLLRKYPLGRIEQEISYCTGKHCMLGRLGSNLDMGVL